MQLTPKLSNFEILHHTISLVQNLVLSKAFHKHLSAFKFCWRHKWDFSLFFDKIRKERFSSKSYFDNEPNCHFKRVHWEMIFGKFSRIFLRWRYLQLFNPHAPVTHKIAAQRRLIAIQKKNKYFFYIKWCD